MTIAQAVFHRSLGEMIAANRLMQSALFDVRQHYTPFEFAANHCIVSCNAGRQIGKTEFILRNATERDAVIALSEKFLHSQFRECLAKKATARTFHRLPDQRFETVYVDEATYVFQVADRDKLIAKFASEDHDTTFVFLA